jgi:hypothetical protein
VPEQKLLYSKANLDVDLILNATTSELSSEDFLCDVIRKTGLRYFPNVYGDDEPYIVDGDGVMQIPIQLSKLMLFLKDKKIKTFIDIGTAGGFTVSLLSAYLLRFNKNLKVTTVDVVNNFEYYYLVKDKLPIKYIVGDYSELNGKYSDFCFIDDGHRYSEVNNNYEEIGKFSKICACHDVNNPHWCPEVCQFWSDLKPKYRSVTELFNHPNDKNTMGIGVVEKQKLIGERSF